jgi:uncharacterized membrane protein YeiB
VALALLSVLLALFLKATESTLSTLTLALSAVLVLAFALFQLLQQNDHFLIRKKYTVLFMRTVFSFI